MVPELSLEAGIGMNIFDALPRIETRSHVKILESHVVVGVGSLEDGLEDDKVVPGDEATLRRVRDAEQGRILGPSGFGQIRLWRDRVHELVDVEEPATAEYIQ